MPTLRLFDNSHPDFPLIDSSGCSDSKLAWTGNFSQWREILADLLLTCTCSCYLYDVMHFNLGENEASHQGPICAVCVDFGHGKTHSWRLGRGTGQWQRSLVRWGSFDQQCNAALVNVLTRSLRIDFITVFRSQTSRIFRRSVLFKSFVILELKYHSVWV